MCIILILLAWLWEGVISFKKHPTLKIKLPQLLSPSNIRPSVQFNSSIEQYTSTVKKNDELQEENNMFISMNEEIDDGELSLTLKALALECGNRTRKF